jgi:DMSO/TMAO reductase YedYZ molybdopterin-dependent catalytic subunit
MARYAASRFHLFPTEVSTMTMRLHLCLVVCCTALLTGLAACTAMPASLPPAPTEPPRAATQPALCAPSPVVAPTPSADPGYAQLDVDTGLHVTGQAPTLDLAAYRLKVTGRVSRPLALTYDELRCLPKQRCRCTLVCPGFFVDTADWAGASLASVLQLAGAASDAQSVELVGADGYSTAVSMAEATAEDTFLAYEWAGQPVPVLHGFPVRAVFPRLSGGQWTKWVTEIRVK